MRHLDLLNVFLALQMRQPGFPACLAELGYLVQTIGVALTLADKARVIPDVIASRTDPDLTLLVEVKGGQDFNGDQLARMARVTAADLRDFAHLPVSDPDHHRVAIVYFCNEDHRESLGQQAAPRGATVIGFDGERFRVSGAALADTDLAACLARAKVAPGTPPLNLVPFDDTSPDEEVARAVIPHIVEAMLQGAGRISVDEIVSRTHHSRATAHDVDRFGVRARPGRPTRENHPGQARHRRTR